MQIAIETIETITCVETTWEELKAGEEMFFLLPARPKQGLYGPFTVVDPAICRLANGGGVQFNFPQVTPFVRKRVDVIYKPS